MKNEIHKMFLNNINKKSQLTVFFLLGIVLVSVFSIFFFVYSNSGEEKRTADRENQYSNLVMQSAIKTSINSCFDAEIVKGLNLLEKQGGIIYELQGGYLNNDIVLPYKGLNVSYGIMRREPDAASFPQPVPDYPYFGKLDKQNLPYFGKDSLPNLCDPFGNNKDCPTYDIFNKSIENQLKLYVIKGVKKCLQNVLLHQSFPTYNITTSDEPNVSVMFGESNVIFGLSYEINFVFADKIISGAEDFKITKDVRLKLLHNFIKEVIDNDVKNIMFDIVKDSYKLKSIKPGFVVSKVENACGECAAGKQYDDIIAVADAESLLDGKPYTFMFARQNRIPALEWVKQQGLELIDDYDIKSTEDGEITIRPVAYDPDEETDVVFSYSGWQETENVYYDLIGRDYVINNGPSAALHFWTSSSLYTSSPPNANYSLALKDIGHHVLRISVKDRQGFEDYQDVKIFVQDKPRFDISGKSNFSGKEYYASIEDPYYLTAKVECIFCESKNALSDTNIHYKFYHSDGKAYDETITKERSYKIDKDINDPFSKPFTAVGDKAKLFVPDVYSVEVAYPSLSVFQCMPYYVADSAPYPYNDINYNNIAQDPSAYTKTVANPFLTTHACCEGSITGATGDSWAEGTFKAETEQCFNIKYSTCNPIYLLFEDVLKSDLFYSRALKDNDEGKLESYSYDSIGYAVTINGVDYQSTDSGVNAVLKGIDNVYLNDIFERNFVQQCSGTRGNACGGEIVQTFALKEECKDKTNIDDDETCFGPKKSGITQNNCFSKSLVCAAYPSGQSFEKDFRLSENANGICNENFKPASINPLKFDATGNWLCQAQCGRVGADEGCVLPNKETCKCSVDGPCKDKTPDYFGPETNYELCSDRCT